MIQIDLITGFLGSGKTTFLKKYAEYLMEQGYHIGIIENDFGAVNVDLMLLKDLEGDNCELEAIVGGNEASDWKRRFKAKLISMAMYGLDRILVEPSGIYDVELFFDVIRDEPADRWYEIGNIITVIDGGEMQEYSEQEEYLLVSQIAHAGKIVYSRSESITEEQKAEKLKSLNQILKKYRCDRDVGKEVLWVELPGIKKEEFEAVKNCGWVQADHEKVWFDQNDLFSTIYLMNLQEMWKNTEDKIHKVMKENSWGEVYRIKGFFKDPNGQWFQINAVNDTVSIQKTEQGQEILIIIGKNLNEKMLRYHLK